MVASCKSTYLESDDYLGETVAAALHRTVWLLRAAQKWVGWVRVAVDAVFPAYHNTNTDRKKYSKFGEPAQWKVTRDFFSSKTQVVSTHLNRIELEFGLWLHSREAKKCKCCYRDCTFIFCRKHSIEFILFPPEIRTFQTLFFVVQNEAASFLHI